MLLTKSLLHTTDVYIKKLREAGVESVRDFLHIYPKGIEDKSDVLTKFALLDIREKQTVRCTIELLTSEMTRNKKLLIKVVLTDSDGSHAEAVWFNQRFILQKFAQGDTVIIYGQPKYEYGRLSFPSCEIQHDTAKRQEIAPVYSDVNYIPGSWIREKMGYLKEYLQSLPLDKGGGGDLVPKEIRNKHNFRTHAENVHALHFPTSIADFDRAKYEIGYGELFAFQKRGIEKKYEAQEGSLGLAPEIPLDVELMKGLIESLPFPLTNKQKIVLFQILKDMEKPHAMARMLQGDVGTGKTIVALLAAIHAIFVSRKTPHSEGGKNLQVAIMAPTEILARQHFAGSEAWLMELGIRSDLLVGSLTPRMKEDARERLKSGQTEIIFGTHALIQDSVQFARLGFVVVDEQHRFGVEQRKALEEYCALNLLKKEASINSPLIKGESGEENPPHPLSAGDGMGVRYPHRLNMSATPIPRSLALTIYGDQDIAVLDEYPAGRKPIHTRVVREERRIEIYRFIEEEVRQGRQVYWISPLVGANMRDEEDIPHSPPKKAGKSPDTRETQDNPFSESKEDIASAIEMQKELSGVFPHLTIGLIHGKMSGKEKDRIMQDFYDNTIQILSSTSVVEVGVNNPNATIICIEAAERFGLSQLHQFRGRVGRGEHQSYCYLFTTKEYKNERLKAMERTGDGFELAEIDLRLRGPGEVYGVRQSGVPDFHFADLRDVDLIAEIREEIEEWVKGKKGKESFAKNILF